MAKVRAKTVMVKAECSRCKQVSNVPVGTGIHAFCAGFPAEIMRNYGAKKINITGKKGEWVPHWLNGDAERAVRKPSFLA